MRFGRRHGALAGAALLLGGLVPPPAEAVTYPTISANIRVGANPTVLAVNTATKKVYVPVSGVDRVDVIDATTNAVTAQIAVGDLPLGAAADPTTNRVYVTIGNEGLLTVIDGATNTVLTSIAVGGGPNFVATDPVLHRAYVSHTGANHDLTVVDTTTNTVAGTITAGNEPQGIAVNATANTIYVANGADGTVSVIDRTTLTAVATVPVGVRPQFVAVDTVANRAYVTNFGSNTVSVIDGASNLVVTTIATGQNPLGVAVNTNVHRLYVADWGGHDVLLFDTATLTLTKTLVPGGTSAPFGVDVLPAFDTAYVADNQQNSVSVVSEQVDTTPPHTTITSHPPALTSSRAGTVTFTVTDNFAPPVAVNSECQRDGGLFSPCTSPVSLTGLADGQHTLAVRSIDESNNVEAPPVSTTWTVDATPPETTFVAVPPDPSFAVTASASFQGSDLLSPAGALRFQCLLDDLPDGFRPCTSPIALSTLLPGLHKLRVRAIDEAGNIDPTPALTSWTVVDKLAPDTTFAPDNGTILVNTTNRAVLTPVRGFATDDVAGIAFIDVTFVPQPSPLQFIDQQKTVRLIPGREIACSDITNTQCRWDAPPSVLPGVYRVYALATDRAGRVEQASPDPITVTVL